MNYTISEIREYFYELLKSQRKKRSQLLDKMEKTGNPTLHDNLSYQLGGMESVLVSLENLLYELFSDNLIRKPIVFENSEDIVNSSNRSVDQALCLHGANCVELSIEEESGQCMFV